jgi:ABC-2 type transport system ATP-binding protein/lipopolysaccharide transport system ATP-binding protein
MENTVIKFENVTKVFSFQNQKTFKEFLPALIKGEKTTNGFTALNKLNFEIKRGEVVGIIGPNGSGKSTILKLIAGVMWPTSGKVHVNGQVSPLIELGAGMHPELTGRENIYLNGAILGLKRKEIDANLQNIIDFSEISEFIDQPVKHYSSGMYMRLAFSIAIHVHPEILLVDEILAVGDTDFQAKCFVKMNDYKKDNNITIIFVSHSMPQVEKFCERVIYLNHHEVLADGNTKNSIKTYLKDQINK